MLSKKHAALLSLAIVLIAAIAALAQRESGRGNRSSRQTAEIIAAYPHDPQAFTQGLAFNRGQMYESTGQYGESSLRRVDYISGSIEQIAPLNRAFFAEGITILDDKIYQLTWRSGVGAIYEIDSFEVIGTFRYAGEGWGLTHNGSELILSDGTASIRFIDPADFSVVRTIEVSNAEGPVAQLNELEYVDDEIWANIWYEDIIVRIDATSGQILGTIDVSKIYPAASRGREEVANGIAYDKDANRLFITGKNWPQLFEIRLVDM